MSGSFTVRLAVAAWCMFMGILGSDFGYSEADGGIVESSFRFLYDDSKQSANDEGFQDDDTPRASPEHSEDGTDSDTKCARDMEESLSKLRKPGLNVGTYDLSGPIGQHKQALYDLGDKYLELTESCSDGSETKKYAGILNVIEENVEKVDEYEEMMEERIKTNSMIADYLNTRSEEERKKIISELNEVLRKSDEESNRDKSEHGSDTTGPSTRVLLNRYVFLPNKLPRKYMEFGEHTIPYDHVVLKTRHSFVFTNIRPFLPFHILVSPIARKQRIHELTSEETSDLFNTARAMMSGLGNMCDGFTLSVQDGASAGQKVFHVHVHIVPRNFRDLERNDDIYREGALDSLDKPARGYDEMKEETARIRRFIRKTLEDEGFEYEEIKCS